MDLFAQALPVESFQRLPADYETPSTSYFPPELPRPTWPLTQPYDHAGTVQDGTYQWRARGRAYYMDDQRVEFTGQERTFGVEGVLGGTYTRQTGEWESTIVGEAFLNQPYERNRLVDTPDRRSFDGNFEIRPFEIQQLFFSTRRNDWMVAIGKMPTPFGRTYFPIVRNDFSDAPFIRTESIIWRETGALVQFDPGSWVITAAIVNGGVERDTNSSKALVSRIGWDGDAFAFGGSVKAQDGIGSEHNKVYKNHVGVDGMLRFGRWTLSGEAIYDVYGFRRAVDPSNITWGRSIYYRDLNLANKKPIDGIGAYLNLGYAGESWDLMLNYGEFHPQQIGVPQHDITTRRGIAKAIYHLYPKCDVFAMWMQENELENGQEGRLRRGMYALLGVEFGL